MGIFSAWPSYKAERSWGKPDWDTETETFITLFWPDGSKETRLIPQLELPNKGDQITRGVYVRETYNSKLRKSRDSGSIIDLVPYIVILDNHKPIS